MDNATPEVVHIFRKLTAQWAQEKNYWVMRHQILASCTDQAQAMTDMNLMTTGGLITQLSLPLNHNEILILASEDYHRIVIDALSHIQLGRRVVEWIKTSEYIDRATGTIATTDLYRALESVMSHKHEFQQCSRTSEAAEGLKPRVCGKILGSRHPRSTKQASSSSSSGASEDESGSVVVAGNRLVVSSASALGKLLVRRGLLRRMFTGRHALCVPGLGHFIENLLKGRKKLLSFIKHRKGYTILSEMSSRHATCLSGSGTSLSVPYLLLDTLGVGLLTEVKVGADCSNSARPSAPRLQDVYQQMEYVAIG